MSGPSLGKLSDLRPWVDRLAGLQVVVLGDLAADHYLVGQTSRISREAPVLILKKREDSIRPGQAGNAAANLAALGVRVRALGFVGDDPEGGRLKAALEAVGVDSAGVVEVPGARTIVKTRVLAGAHHTTLQQVIRLDDDEGLKAGPGPRRRLAELALGAAAEADALLVSDYGYGTVDLRLWRRLGRRPRPLRALDSRYGLLKLKGADLITPNETEVFAQLEWPAEARGDPTAAGRALKRLARCRELVMTRGNEGMFVFDGRGRLLRLPIFGTDEVTDVTGAGDTVAAVATAVRAAGGSLQAAARLATVAAGLVVMKRGAATVSPEELGQALATG